MVFNRPDTTARVFGRIRAARPSRLYIAADGPRATHPTDAGNCRQVREIVGAVDWPCEVKTRFSDANQGCMTGPASAITWFFDNEPEGIILEDDCLPGCSFFRYCDEMLERYRHDTRIFAISGTNKQLGKTWGDASYYIAGLANIWGWATWRRVWRQYDHRISSFPEADIENVLRKALKDPFIVSDWLRYVHLLRTGELVTWDYQFHLRMFFEGGRAVVPNVNLVSNLGFGENATHTFHPDDVQANLPIMELGFPLTHPTNMQPETAADYASLSLDHDLVNRWRRYNKRKRRFLRWCRGLLGGRKVS